MSDARDQQFISEARRAAIQIWEGQQTFKRLQAEWNALDYSTTLEPGAGDNAGVTPAHISSAIFDTANAIEVLLNGGHATNLARLL